MWRAIDGKLDGKAREVQIRVRTRRVSLRSLLLATAAVLLLLLIGAAVVRQLNKTPGPEELVAAEPTPEPTPETVKETRQIALENARVNESPILSVTDEERFLAQAVLPEGMTVDHWEVNGEPVDAGGRQFSLEFESEGVKKVEAVLREERRVTCVNAYLQFLDENGEPAGWMYQDVCFEYDYTVPTTGERHPGGSITAFVSPIDPEAEEPYTWLIDGQAVEGFPPARGIRLENLDRSVHIELVYSHGYRERELTEPIVLGEGGETPPLKPRPADDSPAGQDKEPEESWIEVDYSLDGVPFDPDAPARDGHTHDWVLDRETSRESSCIDQGRHNYVCSICGKKYTVWLEKQPHQFHWEINPQGHRWVCAVCSLSENGFYKDYSPHEWVKEGDTTYCSVCGYVR